MNKSAQRTSKKLSQPKAAVKQQQKRKIAKKAPVKKQSKRNVHVAVIGAAGGIGQPLAMLVKQNQNNLFTKLSVYDVNPLVNGVAADLSHIPTSVQVTGFTNLDDALQGADIVVVPAGVPRKPGMSRDDLFNTNASINFTIANAVAKNCPNARSLIISNPVNSMVPLWAEVLKARGVYDPAKLMGVTTLDVFRATTFTHHLKPEGEGEIPVIGGHAGTTIVPLFSARKVNAAGAEMDELVRRTMFGGDEVVQAKAGGGSATLSMAAAGARFTEQVAQAIVNPTYWTVSAADNMNLEQRTGKFANGSATMTKADHVPSTVDYAFVQNIPAQRAFGTEFFASGIVLGERGVAAVHPTWEVANAAEMKLVQEMIPDLKGQIKKGQEWAIAELAKKA